MSTLTAPTLGRLITNVRSLLGQPNSVNSAWTDAELTTWLNEAVRMYFAEVVQNMEGYFTSTTDSASGTNNLSYTANTEEVSLPSDFFSCKALYIKRSNGWEILEYRNDITSGFFNNIGAGGQNTFRPIYYFRGNSLVLHPTPNFDGVNQLRLDYVHFPEQMVSSGDVVGGTTDINQVSPVFTQLIEMYAVYKAKLKQSMVNGTDLTSLAKQNLGDIYSTFKVAINKRGAYPEFIVPYMPE